MQKTLRPMFALLAVFALAQCDATPSASPVASPPQAASAATSQTALMAEWSKFERAFTTNDFATVIDVMPPKLLAVMAQRAGIPPARMKRTMINTTSRLMSNATVHSASAQPPRRGIQSAQGLPYAILPTTTDITVLGLRQKTTTNTIAIFDAGRWYFVRVADAGADRAVKTAYPQLSNIKLL